MPEYPLVSIITPAYNRSGFLDETIQSVLAQDYPAIEHIVLDDGSTDDTPRVVQKYGDRIIFKSHANMGEQATVNKGFRLAQGEILCVVNSDDPLLPHAIRRMVETLQSDPSLIGCYPDWEVIDQHSRVTGICETFDYDYLTMLRWFYCFPGPGACFRRQVIAQIGGRDTRFRYVGDFDFWLRAGLMGRFHHLPERLAQFRVHADSASISQKSPRMAEENIQLVEKIYRLPDLPAAAQGVRREAYSNAYYLAGLVYGGTYSPRKKLYFLRALLFSTAQRRGKNNRRLLNILGELLWCIPGISFDQALTRIKRIKG